ncbi:isoaspartyl peptidase/L-asparaginase [Elstera cyanobacteriorum]|uniref:Isoaspartyl peptidase n=1 Tax=Elstera cyanobacteriorum TaxID=2022747 RepID=A0A255XWK3_9PROT|nr:isoaspartyl peptidase/L-asparaginase [Elstera cyanobacteriorum]OYQ20764.1 beta-aspartyl-peptidase [Elstera cyanobacteriorum]GFZ82087.1 isoaspartyl peptidase/L-asparaginase [Elstera cyanobacteriorum]
MSVPFTLALHGGAGTIPSAMMTPAKEAAYHAGLARALRAGYAVLENGGAALDAVTAAVCALEDDPLFNAGRGAVYTRDGTQEMDAAIMDGRDRSAGAVAGLFGPKNPILAARAVMDRTPHVLMIGAGALKIARDAGLDFGDRDYFFTQERWDALQSTLALQGRDDGDASRKHGTVGAVARDAQGNLAAATSTGGMTAKLAGRVGDSPVIGAGTFADNETCAVSATGHGELFIRWAAAHEIASRMRHRSESLLVAAEHVTLHDLPPDSGGLIAVGTDGSVALPFNSEGMYRGMIGAGGVAWTGIYREELVAVEG